MNSIGKKFFEMSLPYFAYNVERLTADQPSDLEDLATYRPLTKPRNLSFAEKL
jgi:hypothetical protein